MIFFPAHSMSFIARRFYQHLASTMSSRRVIDLRSDTVSRPSPGMKVAMTKAPLGDDVYGEDPTVNELEAVAARLFGLEASLFLPTGTMSNLTAIMSHCTGRGEELIVGEEQHIFKFEQGGYAQLAGVSAYLVPNELDGTIDIAKLQSTVKGGRDFHEARTRLLTLENTHNMCGGRVLRQDYMEEAAEFCRKNDLKLHVDGARILNAAVALNCPVADLIAPYADSVSLCLSKGLGCPAGSILAGSSQFIRTARRVRKCLGGGMRQAGILAAAGLYAIERSADQLATDHRLARRLAEGVNSIENGKVHIDLATLDTNIIMMQYDAAIDPHELVRRMAQTSDADVDAPSVLLLVPPSTERLRMVTHCDISEEDIDVVVERMRAVVMGM